MSWYSSVLKARPAVEKLKALGTVPSKASSSRGADPEAGCPQYAILYEYPASKKGKAMGWVC